MVSPKPFEKTRFKKPARGARWKLVGMCVGAAAALATAGFFYYVQQVQAVKAHAYEDLKAIANLKIGQIIAWRAERLADARLNSSGITRERVLRWLSSGEDGDGESALLARLHVLRQNEGYQNMMVASPGGRLLLSLGHAQDGLEPATQQLVRECVASHLPVFGDFFRSPVSGGIFLDIAAPILNEERRPVAVLVLRIDPEKQLYPLIQSWPLPSRSGETLLLRREGEDVVYLNMPRYRPGSVLSLRIPLRRTHVPEVQAALGRTGIFDGFDYRDVHVVADLQPVAGSPWFMVAKQDSEEILAEARYRGALVLLLVLLGIITTTVLVTFAHGSRQRALYRALFHAELGRHEAQEEIRATLYGIGDGVIATDIQGRITRMNPVASSLTGWREEEALGRPLEEVFRVVNEATRAETSNPAALVLLKGQVVGLANHSLLIARDGSQRPVADSAAPIRSEQGAVNGVVLVFRDQTAERAAQDALQESEARLRRVIEGTNVGTWEWNVQTDTMILNDRWAGILGCSLSDLAPAGVRLWRDRAHPQDLGGVESQLEEVFARRRSLYDIEYRVKHRDGSWRWVHDRGKVIEWTADGGPVRMAGTRTDITEKRTLESQLRQAQKMESVGRLAGGVAHDFNNMLGVILGHAELAMTQLDPAERIYGDLREIQEAAQRSAELTRQLLAFARKQTVSPRVLDLNESVSDMLNLLRRLIGEDIQLVWKPGRELWQVRMDPTQVHQILANLAVNARDAIAGAGMLTIETTNASLDESWCADHPGFTPGDHAVLSVSDTGTGMDKETFEHLFEPFFTTKETGKGTGLGLATVYGAVTQNHGFIRVDSELGRGTRFEIFLPRVEAVAAATAPGRGKPAPGTGTLLLAEDEDAILRLGQSVLESYGYTVLAARTPSEAIALARSHQGPLDLLITDVVMPGMNGKELEARIASLYPRIRTLFMSGYTHDVIAHHGVIDQGIEFLQKPFSIEVLAQKVNEMLNKQYF